MISKGAIVKTNYLSNVGHTIDFSNRNSILTDGFNWIDSVNNAQLVSIEEIGKKDAQKLLLFPNPIAKGENIQFELKQEFREQTAEIAIHNIDGKEVSTTQQVFSKGINAIDLKGKKLASGVYFISIRLKKDNKTFNQEIVVE